MTDATPAPRTDALRVLYGGTFDPVHEGHLAIARAARDALGATVWLMPAADPPHRAAPGADALHRARMLELACAGEQGLKVDRRELGRDTPSYSIDTVRALRAEPGFGPMHPLALVVGADALWQLPTWREPDALLQAAHLVVAERPGVDLDGELPPALARLTDGRWTERPADLRGAPGGRIYRLRQRLHPASATAIRAALAAGDPVPAWLPAAVAAYSARHGLYAGPGAAS